MVSCNEYYAASKRAVKNAKPKLTETFVKMRKSDTKGSTRSMKVK